MVWEKVKFYEFSNEMKFPVELTWDLSLIYPTEEAMYRDVEKMKALCASMEERFKGSADNAWSYLWLLKWSSGDDSPDDTDWQLYWSGCFGWSWQQSNDCNEPVDVNSNGPINDAEQ